MPATNNATLTSIALHCIKIALDFQKRFHSLYNFGYGILLYMQKTACFCPLTALLGGFMGIFSYINDKSAILCPVGTEVADFVSFKGLIVYRLNIEKV